ncbi:MAG: cytochrome P450 [Pseudomonadales bacterium]|nr:cytochrome P450 [Pseudomonadales bacterium]
MSEVVESPQDTSRLHPANPALFAEERILDLFAELREGDPIHYCADSPYGPYWSITRFDDIKRVDMDHHNFSSEAYHGGIMIDDNIVGDPESDFFVRSFITMDQPEHGQQRKAVNRIVAPQSLANFDALIRSRVQKTLDELPIGETFDWVDKVSIELTTQMLATLFDFPFEERRRLTRWSDVATAEADSPLVEDQASRVAELMECLGWFKELKAQRIGGNSMDLVTMLANDAATKDQPDIEFLGNLMLLIVGGNDTTRNSMSGSINAFHQFPDQLALLRERPELLGNAIAEIVRWQTPLSHMRRTALRDVRVGDRVIGEGDKVVMWYYSGNRQPDVFAHPDCIDITRENARHHLSFGFGIHRCLGMRLAEQQLKILWEEILKRWSRIEIVEAPQRVYSNFVNGYGEMQVRIHA